MRLYVKSTRCNSPLTNRGEARGSVAIARGKTESAAAECKYEARPGDSCSRAHARVIVSRSETEVSPSSPTAEAAHEGEKKEKKNGGRKRETPIAYRAVERDKSAEIEIGKTGVVTRAWIGSKLAISQGSLGPVPDLISITTTSSLPTDYRLHTTASHECLPTAGVARCTMSRRQRREEWGSIPRDRHPARESSCRFPRVITRISPGKIARRR